MSIATRRRLGTAAMLLAAASLLSVLFWWWDGFLLGVAAFLLVFVGVAFSGRSQGLPSPRRSGALDPFNLMVGVVVLSFATLVFSARSGGVPSAGGAPVYAERAVYFLVNHGRKTEVSRLRFLLAGTSFMLGWHGMIVLGGMILANADADKK